MNKKVHKLILIFLTIILITIFIMNINNDVKNVSINKLLKKYDDNFHINIIEDENEGKEDNSLINEDNDIILTLEEINNYNQKIFNKTDELYNLLTYKEFSQKEIENYILKYSIPKNKYNNGELISNDTINEILENRNLNNIKVIKNIKKGIIIKRTNLRSFPTNINFYDTKVNDFDRLQETELLVNTGVIILHESSDNLWYFVMSPIYIGWVMQKDIALANDDDYNFFINNKDFGIIIDKYVEINNITLDMSVKLPYLNDKYIIPVKNIDDYVGKAEVEIPKEKINIGYLPYTKENVIKQAYKYEGTSYSWGGYNKNVDCSSFIMNIYKTFGFNFPRNTSSQNKSVGEVISLDNKNNNEKLNIINNTEPSILYQDGHVMLYVGIKENKHYIIHASGDGYVKESVLEDSNYLKNINKLVLVK